MLGKMGSQIFVYGIFFQGMRQKIFLMKNKIKLQSFYNDILEGEENNYESFLGYCPRPMKLEIVLETAEDAEDLISFLNKVKVALIK